VLSKDILFARGLNLAKPFQVTTVVGLVLLLANVNVSWVTASLASYLFHAVLPAHFTVIDFH